MGFLFYSLQKYRLYLTRLQKENDLKACFGGIKHSDTASPDHSVSFSTQTSITMPQEVISNGNFIFSGNDLPAQNANSKGHEIDMKGISSVPREKPKGTLIAEVPNKQESRGMKIGIKQSFLPFGPEEGHTVFDASAPVHHSLRGVPEVTFKEDHDVHLEDSGHLPRSFNSRSHLTEGKPTKSMEYKPLCADNQRSAVVQVSPVRPQSDSVGVQDKENVVVTYQDFQPIPPCPVNIHGQGSDLRVSGLPSTRPAHGDLSSISGSLFGYSDEDLPFGWLEDDPFSTSLGLQNSELTGYNDDRCVVAEVPIHLYDALRFDYEQFVDPYECSISDHGLFIV